MCPKHGEFWQIADNHLRGQGCPKCGKIISKPEDEIISLFSEIEYQQHNRKILDGMEIDIFIHPLKLGIEYNGLRWHSEDFGKDNR